MPTHYGKIENSKRLQRVLAALRKAPQTTKSLTLEADVYAAAQAVFELRCNGFKVKHEQMSNGNHLYTLLSEPEGWQTRVRRVPADSVPLADNKGYKQTGPGAICKCGCGRHIPPGRKSTAEYYSDEHKKTFEKQLYQRSKALINDQGQVGMDLGVTMHDGKAL